MSALSSTHQMKLLAKIIEKITGVPRYFPEVEWAHKSWTHNVFRAYESVFGRRQGVKPEMTVQAVKTVDEDGVYSQHVYYEIHSFEAMCAFFETKVRELLAWRLKIPVYIHIPVLQTTNGMRISSSPYLFAIAFDASTLGQVSGTTTTFSATVTGSDTVMLASGTSNVGNTVSGETYAGVSLTQQGSYIQDSAGPKTYAHYLLSPTTGANNFVGTTSGSSSVFTCTTYTGVKQTGFPDAYTTVAESTTGSYGVTITTVADNCWVAAFSRTGNGLTLTGSSGVAIRKQPEITMLGAGGFWDSNAALTPAGSKTLTVTCSSQLFGGAHVFSIAPKVATSVTVNATVLSATFSIPAATVTAVQNVTVSSTVLSATFSQPAATVTAIQNATVSPNALTATFSIPTVDVITPDAQILAGTLSATFSLPVPTVTAIIADVTTNAGVQSATFSIGSVTVTGEINGLVEPNALSATFSTPAVVVTAERSVSVDATVLTATFTVQTPRKVGGLWTAQPRVEGVWTPQARVI